MFSERSRFPGEPNALSLALADLSRRGVPVLDLTESNPTGAELPYPGDRIRAALASAAVLEYRPEPFGLPVAREVLGRELAADGIDVSSDRILLTASTSEAYAFAFHLLCDPGDALLVPRPSYPLLEHLAQLADVRLVPYRSVYDGAWHVDLDSLRRAATAERVRAAIVVSPNNPTGAYSSRDELAALAALGLPLISDEVFARYPLTEDPARVTTALGSQAPLVLALGGLSKLAALPQLKLGWMLLGGEPARVDEARARLELIADSFLSVSAPVQHALPELLDAARVTRAAISERARDNLAVLHRSLAGSPANVLHVEGGWYAVVRLPATRSEEDWVLGLLRDQQVLVQPGWFFDFEQEPYVVVSLLTRPEVLGEGVGRIVRNLTLSG